MVKPFKMDVEADDEPKWLVLAGRILRSQDTPTPKKKVSFDKALLVTGNMFRWTAALLVLVQIDTTIATAAAIADGERQLTRARCICSTSHMFLQLRPMCPPVVDSISISAPALVCKSASFFSRLATLEQQSQQSLISSLVQGVVTFARLALSPIHCTGNAYDAWKPR